MDGRSRCRAGKIKIERKGYGIGNSLKIGLTPNSNPRGKRELGENLKNTQISH